MTNITQEDREAAARWFAQEYSVEMDCLVCQSILSGEEDCQDRVAVFARHREAAEAPLKARIAELEAEKDRLLDALFDAVALIAHVVPMDTSALIGGERLTARSVWQAGYDLLFPANTIERGEHMEANNATGE